MKFEVPILFEDKHLLVVDKPAGLVVHPGAGHENDTLINILAQKTTLSPGVAPFRPGLVHRLDRNVSGLMLLSKTLQAQELLIEQFQKRQVKRRYRALVFGYLRKQEGKVEGFIGRHPKDRKKFYCFDHPAVGARQALTHYRAIESFEKQFHHIECQLETGRTHQIRVHLHSIGLPILGDQVYFSRRRQRRAFDKLDLSLKEQILSFNRLTLYSCFLYFIHPVEQKPFSFHLAWPEYFHTFMADLRFSLNPASPPLE